MAQCINDVVWASDWLINETGYGLDACEDDLVAEITMRSGILTGSNDLFIHINSTNHTFKLKCKNLLEIKHAYSPTNYSIDFITGATQSRNGEESTSISLHFHNQSPLTVTCSEVWLEDFRKLPNKTVE